MRPVFGVEGVPPEGRHAITTDLNIGWFINAAEGCCIHASLISVTGPPAR